jgi:hypothetical protein
MIERLFSAVLTFALLAGGTYAVGSELFAGTRHASVVQQAAAVELPLVQVTGRRHAALLALAHGESAPLLCLQ